MEPPENLAGQRTRVGLYGGSFDPVHSAHLAVARRAAEAFELERVLFVPARRPPHKPDTQLAPDDQRLAMLELATADRADWSVDPCELGRVGPSYTIDTVRDLERRLAPAELWMIVGSDNLPGLPDWSRVEELLDAVQPIVIFRQGTSREVLSTLAGRLSARALERLKRGFLDLEPVVASSTDLRHSLGEGESEPLDLPPTVWEYIRSRGLYAPER